MSIPSGGRKSLVSAHSSARRLVEPSWGSAISMSSSRYWTQHLEAGPSSAAYITGRSLSLLWIDTLQERKINTLCLPVAHWIVRIRCSGSRTRRFNALGYLVALSCADLPKLTLASCHTCPYRICDVTALTFAHKLLPCGAKFRVHRL